MSEHLEKRHRYPWPVIETSVRWYHVRNLSYREVAEKLVRHGVDVTHKTIFEWVQKFSDSIENVNKKRIIKPDSWTVEESYVTCNGKWKYMYCAVDKNHRVLDILLRDTRHRSSASVVLRKLMNDSN